jgi:hypothetical protein
MENTLIEGKQVTVNFDKKYASQVIVAIPSGYINKVLCAIGLTSLALENNVPTIVFVPSVSLATSKAAQYPNERSDNTVLAVYGGVTSLQIATYVQNTPVIKILCVYDSLSKVAYLLPRVHPVVDESDRLLAFTKLKQRDGKNVINKLINTMEIYKEKVSFISATPIPLKYFAPFPWMKEIDQVTFEFPNISKAYPILCDKANPSKYLQNGFIRPLINKGEHTFNGITYRKALVFINSITKAVEIVKELKIPKENVGIICGDNFDNEISTEGMTLLTGNYRNLPLVTFITSSGWQGIDIYDDEAITIVVSSVKKEIYDG